APFPWTSISYELQSFRTDGPKKDKALLERRGHYEFPIIAPRWDVTGEDFYGKSPAMNCLGDQMQLQLTQRRKLQAIDKQVNPVMLADPQMQNLKVSLLPGSVV